MFKKCTPLWSEAHFQVKSVKNWRSRTTFGSWDVQKMNAIALKTDGPGPLLGVAMSKKCTSLWREAHFQVKRFKKQTCSDHFWTFRCRSVWQAQGIAHMWRFLKQFKLQPPIHYTTLYHITLHYTTLNYTTLHPTTLRSATHDSTTLHYTALPTLHYPTLHSTPLQSTTSITTTTTTSTLQPHHN